MESGSTAVKLLEVLANTSTQIVFAYKISDHNFVFLNPYFEILWQLKRESVMQNPASLWDTIHPQDQQYVQTVYKEILKGEITEQFEFRILPAHNEPEKWLCVTPFLLAEEQVIIGYAADITSQKHYNNVLKKYAEKKNSILNILSHDLAGSLSMITNLTNMLESDLKTHANKEVHQVLHIIEKASRQGTKMLQEFINQEFLESSQSDVIKRRFNLVAPIKACIVEYQQTQELTGKVFHFQTNADPIFLELDDTKFMQVINNLISNALKFTPDGGEITVTLEENESSVLLKVQDNGIGIPEKYQDILFDKFTKARRPGIKGEPSTGLGMSIIKTIVKWHQGKIWFESKENKGTTFYIEIPKNH